MTQFEIECRCGRHSVTKKFMTILQILVAKTKFWKKLYFYKEYIFNLKNNFFGWKVGKCSKLSLKMVYFRKNSLKKLDTLFGRWWFLFFLNGWCICLKKQKKLRICKTILKKLDWGKNVFSQQLPCKKIAVKFVIFFFNKYFLIFFYLVVIFFVLYKKLKIDEDSYLSVF